MRHDKLKEFRSEMGAGQEKMADLIGVPKRTYQNWEQPPESPNHRKIPKEMADRVHSLVSLRMENDSSDYLPKEIIWLQVPVLPHELEALDRKSRIEDQHRMVLLRAFLFDGLKS